ncbi:MAG: thioredoxin family protein [Actinomycetales bacterium]|nr:thioredoxin family protein [Actinomycetales bacterium]
MNRRILVLVGAAATVIVVAVVALALLGGARGALETTGEAAPPAASASAKPSASAAPSPSAAASDPVEPGDAATTAGVYRGYSPEALAEAQGRVLLFFHAPWCPQCRSLEADIAAQGVPDGVTILQVDYDTHQDLRQKYGVTLQTSFVEVDTSGTALQPVYVAYSDPHLAPTLAALLGS